MVHINRVDLNLFIVLDAIYREGNITRASQKLYLTQPAVSHALGRLRELLKDPLFVRQGTQMIPTPYTRQLIVPIQQALQTFEHSVNQEPIFEALNSERHFCLGLRDVLEASILPPLLQYLQQHAPHISLSSVRLDRQDLESELTAGNIDFALEIPYAVSDTIEHSPVVSDQLVVVARQQHPALTTGLDLEN